LPWHFDRDGNPISWERWAELLGQREPDYRRVGADVVGDLSVSTVWIGIDVTFALRYSLAPPMIYETIIFAADDDHPLNMAMMRYGNEIDAYEGHQRTVADMQAGRTPWFMRDVLDPASNGGVNEQ
jgi:hypothetical protein